METETKEPTILDELLKRRMELREEKHEAFARYTELNAQSYELEAEIERVNGRLHWAEWNRLRALAERAKWPASAEPNEAAHQAFVRATAIDHLKDGTVPRSEDCYVDEVEAALEDLRTEPARNCPGTLA